MDTRQAGRLLNGTFFIVQFRSMEDAMAILEKEKESAACQAFFAVMHMGSTDESGNIEFYQSLVTYNSV